MLMRKLKEIIKEVKGEKEAKEYEDKVDYQLEKALEVLSKKLNLNYVAKVNPKPIEKDKDKAKETKEKESKNAPVKSPEAQKKNIEK